MFSLEFSIIFEILVSSSGDRNVDNREDIHTCLPALGEWCFSLNFPKVGIYETYLLKGFRLPLNAFAREILPKLGIAPN